MSPQEAWTAIKSLSSVGVWLSEPPWPRGAGLVHLLPLLPQLDPDLSAFYWFVSE